MAPKAPKPAKPPKAAKAPKAPKGKKQESYFSGIFSKKEEPDLSFGDKCKMFGGAHWRGLVIFLLPIILLIVVIPFPGLKWQWCAYVLLIMAIFWVAEVIPLPVTGFLPIFVFPIANVSDTFSASGAYVNDSVVMFLGSLILAFSIEQSGYHKRLAYFSIRLIGYSHTKLLMAMCIVTTFVSMWITNTAATSMMVPILFAILKVFEDEGIIKMYEKDADGNKVAGDVTSVYFCGASFSATVGGIGTLVGTGTNLVFKALMVAEFPDAPEYLSFPKFSAFAVPYMLALEVCVYVYLAVVYFGFLRPKSAVAIASRITEKAEKAARKTIEDETKKLGSITYWEVMVVLLFGGAVLSFFCRSPQIFTGWGDAIVSYFGIKNKKFVKDSSLAMITAFLMYLLPSSLLLFKNFTAKYHEDLPKVRVRSVLDWKDMNAAMPYSFMFLLGGGVALSRGCKSSGLNAKLGEYMSNLKALNNYTILFIVIFVVVFVTNFASNVAVCNVFTPIAMTLAKIVGVNPLWYNIASGFSASYCFMLAVGTPGNLIVKSVALIPPGKMMKAGFGPTITTIIITWVAMCFWAPIIWPDLRSNAHAWITK